MYSLFHWLKISSTFFLTVSAKPGSAVKSVFHNANLLQNILHNGCRCKVIPLLKICGLYIFNGIILSICITIIHIAIFLTGCINTIYAAKPSAMCSGTVLYWFCVTLHHLYYTHFQLLCKVAYMDPVMLNAWITETVQRHDAKACASSVANRKELLCNFFRRNF